MEPTIGVEPMTPFLPRTCSTSELCGPWLVSLFFSLPLVEGVGFEPTKPFRAPDLQSGGISRSPTPPVHVKFITYGKSTPSPWPPSHIHLPGSTAREGIRTHQPTDYKSVALPLRYSGT